MTNVAMVVAMTAEACPPLLSYQMFERWHLSCGLPYSKEHPMIDSKVEEYVREHEAQVRRLAELYEKIRSPEYNEEEKNKFRHESLKLCMKGLMTRLAIETADGQSAS